MHTYIGCPRCPIFCFIYEFLDQFGVDLSENFKVSVKFELVQENARTIVRVHE